MSVYTPELELALRALSVDGSAITFAMAETFAAEHGLKSRSVVGKVKSMKLPYEPKPTKVTKTGDVVVAKATIVAAIEIALSVKVPSLEKATKEDLIRILSALPDTETSVAV